ncbi:hypothetical protein ACFWCA_12340 [Streptomyces phaeochromogenes]|uniref:hypothetical protein n=1 Tax=Streptomyces phaeochromogenes TaxID=1923 RepID=UPI00369FA916
MTPKGHPDMSLSRTRSRTLAAVGFLAATGLFLTACGPEDSAGADASSSAGASDSPSASAPAGSPAPSGGADASEPPAGSDGTFSGKLTFLAPGKLLVGERAFWVAEDTVIQGAGICGDPETAGAENCTADQLDDTAKAGNTEAEVSIEKGIATKVFAAEGGGGDSSEAPAGSDGTFSGKLTFLAPGKLLVGERAFWVAEDTEITGGDICGDPETSGAEKCTADDLDAAAEAGNLTVEVTIKKGIAGRVTQK